MDIKKWLREDLGKQSFIGILIVYTISYIGNIFSSEQSNKILALWEALKTIFWGIIIILIFLIAIILIILVLILFYQLIKRLYYFFLCYWKSEEIYSLIKKNPAIGEITKKEIKESIKSASVKKPVKIQYKGVQLVILKSLIEHEPIHIGAFMNRSRLSFQDTFNIFQELIDNKLIYSPGHKTINNSSFIYLTEVIKKDTKFIKDIVNV